VGSEHRWWVVVTSFSRYFCIKGARRGVATLFMYCGILGRIYIYAGGEDFFETKHRGPLAPPSEKGGMSWQPIDTRQLHAGRFRIHFASHHGCSPAKSLSCHQLGQGCYCLGPFPMPSPPSFGIFGCDEDHGVVGVSREPRVERLTHVGALIRDLSLCPGPLTI
jgi:hypothetical protein